MLPHFRVLAVRHRCTAELCTYLVYGFVGTLFPGLRPKPLHHVSCGQAPQRTLNTMGKGMRTALERYLICVNLGLAASRRRRRGGHRRVSN